MKLIQFKDAEGINNYIPVDMIIRLASVAVHTTEVECRNGTRYRIPVNTMALIARIYKEEEPEIIETAPDADGQREIVVASSINALSEHVSPTILSLPAAEKKSKAKYK